MKIKSVYVCLWAEGLGWGEKRAGKGRNAHGQDFQQQSVKNSRFVFSLRGYFSD